MKRCIYILIFWVSTLSAVSQVGGVKIGISTFYNGKTQVNGIGVGIVLEYRLSQNFTFAGSVDYTNGEGSDIIFIGTKSYSMIYKSPTLSFRPECRYYLKESMNGFFFGFGINVGNYGYGYLINGTTISSPPALIVNNQFFVNPTFVLGLNIQPIPKFCIEINGGIGVSEEFFDRITIPIGLRFGYSF